MFAFHPSCPSSRRQRSASLPHAAILTGNTGRILTVKRFVISLMAWRPSTTRPNTTFRPSAGPRDEQGKCGVGSFHSQTHCVTRTKMRLRGHRDEEYGGVGVHSGIAHAQRARHGVATHKILVLKHWISKRRSSSSSVRSEVVTALHAHPLAHFVQHGTLVSLTIRSSTQLHDISVNRLPRASPAGAETGKMMSCTHLQEVFHRLRNNIILQIQ